MQQGQPLGRELRKIVREEAHSAGQCDHRGPDAGFVERERRPYDEAIGIVEPDGAVVEAAERRRARRRLDAGPARLHVVADSHAVYDAGGVLQWRPTSEEKRFRAQPFAERRQPAAIGFGAGESAVVRHAGRRPLQKIDLQVVVAPLPHHAAGEIVQPLLGAGMRAIERQDSAAPRFARVQNEGRALGRRPFEEPRRIRLGNVRSLSDREGSDPEACLKPRRVNPIGEPAVAVRELGIHVPLAGGALVAVVELDVA